VIDLRIVELASDPQLIPGIYNTCDQWCDYCPATERCLSFKVHRGRVTFEGRNLEDAMFGSMRRLCDCYEAEGLEPPEDMRRLLEGDTRGVEKQPPDPIERMAGRYLAMVAGFMATCDHSRWQTTFAPHAHGPTPFETFLYYHFTIAVKASRAIASEREADSTGRESARQDALCSAKVALIAIDRSSEALQVMALDDPDPGLGDLRRHLGGMRSELDRRFQGARAFVRRGLDDGVAP
jgi:hypothetical protein